MLIIVTIIFCSFSSLLFFPLNKIILFIYKFYVKTLICRRILIHTSYNHKMMLYYIHGYQSEPNSIKGILFKEKLNATPIKYRDCKPEELVISKAVKKIMEQIQKDNNVVLIGSSLGGLLAVKTAMESKNVKQLILLNPAIIPLSVDITKIQGIPLRILQEMQDEQLFREKILCETFLILGTRDDVVPNEWGIEFAKKTRSNNTVFT